MLHWAYNFPLVEEAKRSGMEKKAKLDRGGLDKSLFQRSPEVLQRQILGFLNGKELLVVQVTSMHFKDYLTGISAGSLHLWSTELIRLERLWYAKQVASLKKKWQRAEGDKLKAALRTFFTNQLSQMGQAIDEELLDRNLAYYAASLPPKLAPAMEKAKQTLLEEHKANVDFFTREWKEDQADEWKEESKNTAPVYLCMDYKDLFNEASSSSNEAPSDDED
jgi:hypothetical protein